MKNLRIALFTVTALVALHAKAQSVEEVIDKHIEAIGGKEKLAGLKSVRMETNLSVQGMDIPVVTTKVQGVGQRVDISAMGMDGYIINTPTAGWSFMPFMGQSAVEALPEEQVKEGAEELDVQGPLFNYKEKGHTVELQGKETLDGVESYKVKFTSKGGKTRTYYIDAKTYYLVRATSKQVVMGQEQEVVFTYANFKKTDDGLVFPFSIGGAFGQGDMTVTKIEINKPVDEKLFKAN